MISRRCFLCSTSVLALTPRLTLAANEPVSLGPGVTLRAITRREGAGKFHWFGYYDKHQFDPTGRFALGMEVDFEHRSPRPEDRIAIGMVDLHEGDRWIELGTTRAWNWQQGCMLQWVPGTESTILWNDREHDRFVCHLMDVRSRERRTIPHPVYNVSPDGRWGIAPDFRRLNDCRPGYGYAGLPDPNREVLIPEDVGIQRIDLTTGEARLIVTIKQAADFPYEPGYSPGAKHWFNHLLFNPDGSRFIFLHRWRGQAEGPSFSTRMFTAAADGSDLYVLDPLGKTSHFIWRDAQHVCAFAYHPSRKDRFYLFKDKTREVEPVGPDVMTVNGHNTYLPGTRDQWILNDTYPDRGNYQNVYLFHVATGRRVPLASLRSEPPYRGEWRCDTHPRSSRDGRLVCVDSPHAGGRQMYLLELPPLNG